MNKSKIIEKIIPLEERIKKYFPNFEKNGFLAIANEENSITNDVCLIIHDDEGYHRGHISLNKNFSPFMIMSQEGLPLGFYMHYTKKSYILGAGDERGKDLDIKDGIELILNKTKQIRKPEYKIK